MLWQKQPFFRASIINCKSTRSLLYFLSPEKWASSNPRNFFKTPLVSANQHEQKYICMYPILPPDHVLVHDRFPTNPYQPISLPAKYLARCLVPCSNLDIKGHCNQGCYNLQHLLQLSMLSGPLLLWVHLAAVEKVHP